MSKRMFQTKHLLAFTLLDSFPFCVSLFSHGALLRSLYTNGPKSSSSLSMSHAAEAKIDYKKRILYSSYTSCHLGFDDDAIIII